MGYAAALADAGVSDYDRDPHSALLVHKKDLIK